MDPPTTSRRTRNPPPKSSELYSTVVVRDDSEPEQRRQRNPRNANSHAQDDDLYATVVYRNDDDDDALLPPLLKRVPKDFGGGAPLDFDDVGEDDDEPADFGTMIIKPDRNRPVMPTGKPRSAPLDRGTWRRRMDDGDDDDDDGNGDFSTFVVSGTVVGRTSGGGGSTMGMAVASMQAVGELGFGKQGRGSGSSPQGEEARGRMRSKISTSSIPESVTREDPSTKYELLNELELLEMPSMANGGLKKSTDRPKNPNFSQHNRSANFYARKQRILEQRKSLPIASVEKRLVKEVQKNDTLIIVGETGSGKTTQLPQFLFNGGFCRDGRIIGITQPRRVAAITVAKRVAEECGVELGQRVGYSIRFDDATSGSTRIKYMTDGLLLREALLDPYLSRYSVIIVDEAHERTVHTDVLLGVLKNVQNARSKSVKDHYNIEDKKANNGRLLEEENRAQCISSIKQCDGRKFPPLKLIIMSASLDARVFSEYFGDAKAVHVQGRQFPVDIFYTLHAEPDYLEAALITIFQIHLKEGPGDVLVFLTGQEEIESVERLVQERLLQLPEDSRKLSTVPIFSSLPSEQQMRVFVPAKAEFRKVILATNIAETSVTIPGIKYVIDPGFVKARSYDPVKGMESLIIVPTSKAQALQRSGRAGREGPGKCFRLYPESEFNKLEDSTKPEIKRCNLSNVILQLKALGVDDIVGFDFMEKPSRAAIVKSLEQLFLLGALTDDCKLSDPVGRQMARLPLDPVYSKALILASQFNCLEEMLITVAMLSVESIFYAPREKLEESRTATKCFASPEGDHLTLINVYRASCEILEKRKLALRKDRDEKILRKWCKENFINCRSLKHARDIHSQIQGHVEQMGLHVASCGDDMLQFRKCLAASFFLNAALKQPEGTYRALASGQVVQIHPSSVLYRTKAECIIFNELVQTSHKYIRNITRIDYLWLTELAPHYYTMQI